MSVAQAQASATSNQAAVHSAAEVLRSIRTKGVELWSENGQLRFKAPKGALTAEEIARLKASKGEIVSLLERASVDDSGQQKLTPRSRSERVPLAFSQQSHWNLHRLEERPAIRQIASATRLRGRLSIETLEQSITLLVRRHEALRARVVIRNGAPEQVIDEPVPWKLSIEDLTSLPENEREPSIGHRVEQFILEPVDVAAGSLFGARLLKLTEHEHVLTLAMEHMISDAYSMGVVLRDLFAIYVQVLKGSPLCLPELPVQFPDYAVWQAKTQEARTRQHGAYWERRLQGCPRLRFPEDLATQNPTPHGWGAVPVLIDRELKSRLRERCRLRRTTLALGVFSAYAAFVLKWCGASQSIFQYQSDGRISPQVENAVGYFAAALYLSVEIHENDTFVDLIKRVTAEYCQAYEHIDFSYLEAQVPRPGFTHNTAFNWVPHRSRIDISHLEGSDDALVCSPVPFAHPILKRLERDNEPVILMYDTEEEIVGTVSFPLNRFSLANMERFAHGFLARLEQLLGQPDQRLKDLSR